MEKCFNVATFQLTHLPGEAGKFGLITDVKGCGELETEIGAGRKIDFWFRQKAKSAVDHQAYITVRIESGQMPEAAGNAALWSIRRADAINDPMANGFAGIIGLHHL